MRLSGFSSSLSLFSVFLDLCISTNLSRLSILLKRKDPLQVEVDAAFGLKSFLAGVIAVMLGIGGGFILVPLCLELGMSPRSSAAISNFLIIYSSLASTILFGLAGQVNFQYGIVYGVLCGAASLVGNSYVNEYIKRTGKSSILILLVLCFVLMASIMMPLSGIRKIIFDLNNGNPIFGVKSFC